MWDPVDQTNCNSEILPLGGFSFITPTTCNDGQNRSDTNVDNWLSNSSRLPALFNSVEYKSGRVLVEIWYDQSQLRPNLFACFSCNTNVSSSDPSYSGESLLWLNLLGAPSTGLGGISNGSDIRSIIGTL